ncbi:MAG TPA: matrixin family metalloprotease, partial [Synergistaceae bacterium]|nr:matrixin family metalloprotease [Synergistaceae bacterium]
MNMTRDNFDWQSTVVHEFGHILGLAHSSVGQFNSNFSTYRSTGYNAPTDALDVIGIGSVPSMHPTSSGTGTGR